MLPALADRRGSALPLSEHDARLHAVQGGVRVLRNLPQLLLAQRRHRD